MNLVHGQPLLVALRPGEDWTVRGLPPMGDLVRSCALVLGGDGAALVDAVHGRLTAPRTAGIYRVGCFIHHADVAWVRVGD